MDSTSWTAGVSGVVGVDTRHLVRHWPMDSVYRIRCRRKSIAASMAFTPSQMEHRELSRWTSRSISPDSERLRSGCILLRRGLHSHLGFGYQRASQFRSCQGAVSGGGARRCSRWTVDATDNGLFATHSQTYCPAATDSHRRSASRTSSSFLGFGRTMRSLD